MIPRVDVTLERTQKKTTADMFCNWKNAWLMRNTPKGDTWFASCMCVNGPLTCNLPKHSIRFACYARVKTIQMLPTSQFVECMLRAYRNALCQTRMPYGELKLLLLHKSGVFYVRFWIWNYKYFISMNKLDKNHNDFVWSK